MSAVDCWGRMASMAKLKLSVSIQKGSESWDEISTGVVITAILRAPRAVCSWSFYSHALSEHMRLNRGWAIVKKSCINPLRLCFWTQPAPGIQTVPSKIHTSLDRGTAYVLLRSQVLSRWLWHVVQQSKWRSEYCLGIPLQCLLQWGLERCHSSWSGR